MNFSVAEGEFVGILGPSGCGKSSLLNVIAGLETPTSGTLLIDGKPIEGVDSSRFLISQQACLFPWLTIAQNVEFGPKMSGMSAVERHQTAKEMLEAVGLSEWQSSFPHQLSGGMKQRAAVARALVNKPEFLLMDEPFAALDYLSRLGMQDFVSQVQAKFRPTVLFVTHMPEEAVALANRILILAPRPTRVVADLDVCLPVSRDKTSDAFVKILVEVHRHLSSE